MRWPVRYQISLPMAAVMLLATATASGLHAYLAARATRSAIEERIRSAAAIVTDASFPLTDSVLRQLQGLARAEFLVVDRQGRVTASSTAVLPATELPLLEVSSASELTLEAPDRFGGREYFHAGLPLRPRPGSTGGDTLHVLYPVEEYRAAWRSAVFPSLGVVLVAIPAVVGLALVTAARISRRAHRLQDQLRRIAAGDFRTVPLPRRDDELRDLAAGVNQTAAMLARYEDQVRASERMQTLVHLGGAVAHQLRNAATGCRMALHFHTEDCSLHDDESLRVARRQLELMEEYVRRFLQLGKAESSEMRTEVDLAQVVTDVVPLVEPAAKHAGVQLQWQSPTHPAVVRGEPRELSQLLINLLTNAIKAAAQPAGRNGSPPQVCVEIEAAGGERVRLEVSDTGPGPGPGVADRLFEPFVSEKKDGIGLGLSVVRTVARQHNGEVRWERRDGRTRFIVELPHLTPEAISRET